MHSQDRGDNADDEFLWLEFFPDLVCNLFHLFKRSVMKNGNSQRFSRINLGKKISVKICQRFFAGPGTPSTLHFTAVVIDRNLRFKVQKSSDKVACAADASPFVQKFQGVQADH